ncbi:MAG: hypothetical protein M0Z71_03905 [Nitrospiraceae bacterium]|nr:hypothetical protein [Nitrospiraceae bacterium]
MVRMITQVLAGLMLLFGAATLFPKAYFEYRFRRTRKSLLYFSLGLLALFFSIMAFVYAYLILSREILV